MDYDFIVYTDGGYSLMNDVGAFAYVICDGNENEIKRNAWKITKESNNRAELKAIIAALHNIPRPNTRVLVVSDSQYALNTLSGKWGHRNNHDLFDVFHKVNEEKCLTIDWKWVRGHSGNKFNEICDKLCNKAAGMDLNAEFSKYRK